MMEYIQGTDMKSLILEQGKLPVPDALPLILQACAGIGYAHRAGLVHCDVKPHNLIITRDKRAEGHRFRDSPGAFFDKSGRNQ